MRPAQPLHPKQVAGNDTMMKFSNNQSGFTLIELLVVLAIVAILSVIGVPSYNKFIEKGEFAEAYNGFYNTYRFARAEAIKTSSGLKIQRFGSPIGQFIVLENINTAVYAEKLGATPFLDFDKVEINSRPIAINANGALDDRVSVSFEDMRNGTKKFICILQNGQSYKSDSSCWS